MLRRRVRVPSWPAKASCCGPDDVLLMSGTKHWRRLRMGLQTLFGPGLGLRKQGFFIPYRYADGVAPEQPVYAALAERFAAAEPIFLDLLRGAEDYAEALLAIVRQRGVAPAPQFDQDWFPTWMPWRPIRWCGNTARNALSRSARAIQPASQRVPCRMPG